ncbi:MAG: recombinase RecA [bacterium]|nr:recombinase RecA [bacterium]
MAKKEKESKPAVERKSDEEKKEALSAVFKIIEKEYGKGSIMKLGDTHVASVDAIPTGSMTLDLALGVGGMPRGRVIEIYGPESSGKTTVALHVVAQAQKMGGEAAFIDAEHALDPVYAKALGVDVDNLIVAQPDTGEQALDICEALVRSGALDVIVIDSVAALVPKAEIEGEMGDTHVGLLARLMSQALRKLTAIISKSGTAVIFINQLREKVGVMYGNPETTPGGRALKFFASVRLDVRRQEAIKSGTEIIGNKTKVKVVKNKVAPPFKEAEFDIMYGKGISREGNILDVAVELGIIKKAGAWFSYNGEKIGQGRDNVRKYMTENTEFCQKIEALVRENLKLGGGKSIVEPNSESAAEDVKESGEENNADEELDFSIDEMNEFPE